MEKRKIVVYDSDQDMVEFYQSTLSDIYEVFVAPRKEDVIEMVSQLGARVLVYDKDRKFGASTVEDKDVISGVNNLNSGTSIVLTSCYDFDDEMIAICENGVGICVQKPFMDFNLISFLAELDQMVHSVDVSTIESLMEISHKKIEKSRVLFVDDDNDIRELMIDTFSLHGYDIDVAATGDECINLFSHNKYNYVIMDYVMPGLNGIETSKMLKSMDTDVCIIMMTGFANSHKELPRMAGEAGIYSIIPKPFSLDVLASSILNDRVESVIEPI